MKNQTETDTTTPVEVRKKRRRKRTKGILKAVKEQMEFYFSDANLSKDRYLSHLIEDTDDGYVDLEVFKTFNRIKSLTLDSNLIAKALNDSPLLEINNEHRMVRRKTEILEPDGVREKTIYVEHLPATATHDWIKKLFSPYGEIAYISLPRFHRSSNLKGFSFVEFKCVTSALKACEHFGASCSELKEYLSALNSDLESAKNSPVKDQDTGETKCEFVENEGKKSSKLKRNHPETEECDATFEPKKSKSVIISSDQTETTQSQDSCVPVQDKKQSKKLKRNHPKELETEGCNFNVDDAKKSRLTSDKPDTTHSEAEACDSNVDNVKKRSFSSDKADTTQSETEDNLASCSTEKKSRRKKKKRSKQNVVVEELETISLRVMSKLEWINWRKKYLQIQKAAMREIKKSLLLFNLGGSQSVNKEDTPLKSVADKENEHDKPIKAIAFVADVILKVSLKNPLTDVKTFKNEVKKIVDVAFIDMGLNPTIHIRCHDKESAKTLIEQKDNIPEAQDVHLLQGEEEKFYWDKISADREQKLTSKTKSNRMRGFQRIVLKAEKAAKHIRFDESGDIIADTVNIKSEKSVS